MSEQLWKQAEDQKLNPACAQVETDWDLVAVLFGNVRKKATMEHTEETGR